MRTNHKNHRAMNFLTAAAILLELKPPRFKFSSGPHDPVSGNQNNKGERKRRPAQPPIPRRCSADDYREKAEADDRGIGRDKKDDSNLPL
ncbi:hypothetical protein BHE74_00054041 [Ensete ventricosum]|nr:hypothetical protein GW17_00025123 [Ensete ventricosum]RWW40539.1 hypothetical protein BHE74_00054041 [Ensete ventricosum]RZS15531.1 hypothetical protein BHM03_00047383 [Ensete ventricosum]